MKKVILKLKLIHVDRWRRNVYEEVNTKQLFKDTDCMNNAMSLDSLCTVGSKEGEPDTPLSFIEDKEFEMEMVYK
jgi:hypothetical protein